VNCMGMCCDSKGRVAGECKDISLTLVAVTYLIHKAKRNNLFSIVTLAVSGVSDGKDEFSITAF